MFRLQTLSNAVFLAKQEEAKSSKPFFSNMTKGVPPKVTTVPKESQLSYLPSTGKSFTAKDFKPPRSTLSSKDIMA